jgi:threonine 3-dehydrogenase
MNVLITGAAGQIGTDLLQALQDVGDQVYAADLRLPPRPPDPRVQWIKLDVTDAAAVRDSLDRARPQAVFHLAAVLSARGEADPQLVYAVNQTGTYNVLEACRRAGVADMIFASSIAAFSPDLGEAVGDDAPQRPTTLYGVTKVCGELLGEYYHRRYGLNFRSLRFPGLISATPPGGGVSDYSQLMYLQAAAQGGYQAYCRPDTRIPLMYMTDAVRALLELARAPRANLRRCVYNVAAMSPTAGEIADAVTAALPRSRITFQPDPARQAILDSWPRSLDDRHARADWGWSPRFDLPRMTADLIPRLRF